MKKYIVHEVRGGLMEDPEFHYHNPEEIVAESSDEAKRIYDRRNSLYYFTGSIKTKLGKTTEPKTSRKPLSAERNEHRIEFYGKDVK